MKKYWSLIISFLLGIIFILFYKFWVSWLIYNEVSYTMNWVEPRFVKTFRYTPITKVETISSAEIELEKEEYFEKLSSLVPKIDKIINPLKLNEVIYIFVEDLANAWYTAKVVNWEIYLLNEIDNSSTPTMTFKINKEDIDWIEYFLQDDVLDEEESLKIADVLMVWIVENLYRQEKFYKASDMSMFKFDDFMQFEIKNDKEILRAWKLLDLKVSILNVDWQWIVKKWFYWDPDIRFSITMKEALDFYKIVSTELKNSNTKKDSILISKKAFDILIPNITYVRKDHE